MHRLHWKLLLVEHGLGAGAINAAINGGVAWLLFGAASPVPLWGLRGVAADLLATGFLLPFLYTVIATPLLRRSLRQGTMPRLPAGTRLATPLRWLPAKARLRGVALGLLAAATAAPATIAVLAASDVESLSGPQFIAFKAAWAAALAAAVGPVIALTAVAEPREPETVVPGMNVPAVPRRVDG